MSASPAQLTWVTGGGMPFGEVMLLVLAEQHIGTTDSLHRLMRPPSKAAVIFLRSIDDRS